MPADFGIPPEIMKKVKEDACLRYQGTKNPLRILDMTTGEYLEPSRAVAAFICLPSYPKAVLDNLGMSVTDPRNIVLTCEEVRDKLYNHEICLMPTDTGIVVKVLNPELLRPDGPERVVHRNNNRSNRDGNPPQSASGAGQGRNT